MIPRFHSLHIFSIRYNCIYRVSRRYCTARKRRPNHLDSFKNDNQDVFWKLRFKNFLAELEFLKNMKKWKFYHIGEKSWSENLSINFSLEFWSSVFFKQLLISQSKWFPKPKFYIFWACIDPYKIPRPQGVKVIMREDPKKGVTLA